jgi:hypothetical protein
MIGEEIFHLHGLRDGVFPHRNAGCAREVVLRDLTAFHLIMSADDQTVAEDYFAAMERVEERLKIAPPEPEESIEVVKVQEKMFQLIGKLELPELCLEERLSIAVQLREALGKVNEHAPPNNYGTLEEGIRKHTSTVAGLV